MEGCIEVSRQRLDTIALALAVEGVRFEKAGPTGLLFMPRHTS